MTPVRVRGVVFPCSSAAAAAVGVQRPSIWRAIREGREDTVGLRVKGRLAAIPVERDGVVYRSACHAARVLGYPNGDYVLRAARSGRLGFQVARDRPQA